MNFQPIISFTTQAVARDVSWGQGALLQRVLEVQLAEQRPGDVLPEDLGRPPPGLRPSL